MLTICHIIDNKLCAKTLFRKLDVWLVRDVRISFSSGFRRLFSLLPTRLGWSEIQRWSQFEDIRREYEFGAGTIKGVAR